jgi:putative endonuclease
MVPVGAEGDDSGGAPKEPPVGAEGDDSGGAPKEPPVGPRSTRDRGRAAEQAVATYLRDHGLEIVDQNYTGAGAELDLVACERAPDGGLTYVFVEVRSRASAELGSPLETVDAAKQRRVIRAATSWLLAHELWERVEVRFDVVAVEHGHAPTWIRGAFEHDR